MIPVEAVTRFSPCLSSTRRGFLFGLTAASAALPCLLAVPGNAEVIPSGGLRRSFDRVNSATMASNSDESVRLFHIEFPDSAIVDLRARVFEGQAEGFTREDILENITLYWLTNTAVSSARLYWESKLSFFAPKHIAIPVAVNVFPDEIYTAPPELGRKSLSQAHPLQPAPQRWPLCSVGAAASFCRRASCFFQIIALIVRNHIATQATILKRRSAK